MFARGTVFFPVAGALIGVCDAFVCWLLGHWMGPFATACLVVLFDIRITGGLHLDGLADTTDAFGSLRDRDRMLEIMKDSRIGTFGVLDCPCGCCWASWRSFPASAGPAWCC